MHAHNNYNKIHNLKQSVTIQWSPKRIIFVYTIIHILNQCVFRTNIKYMSKVTKICLWHSLGMRINLRNMRQMYDRIDWNNFSD